MIIEFTNGIKFYDLDAVKSGAVKTPGYYIGRECLIAARIRSAKNEVGFVELPAMAEIPVVDESPTAEVPPAELATIVPKKPKSLMKK